MPGPSQDYGKGVKRLDTATKTTGKMVYGINVKLPGMLNAAIKACPVFGGNMMRIGEMPKVELILMPSGGFWGGVGEATIPAAAALLNAYFAATGKRIRSVPLSGHDITFA